MLVGPSGGGKTTLLNSLKHMQTKTSFAPSAVYNVERIKYSYDSSRFLFHVFDLPGVFTWRVHVCKALCLRPFALKSDYARHVRARVCACVCNLQVMRIFSQCGHMCTLKSRYTTCCLLYTSDAADE